MNPVPVWVMMASPWLGPPEESPGSPHQTGETVNDPPNFYPIDTGFRFLHFIAGFRIRFRA